VPVCFVDGKRGSLVNPEPIYVSDQTAVFSVVADDGTSTAMIYRHAEPLMAEADIFAVVLTVDGDFDSDVAAHVEFALHQAIESGMPVCLDLRYTGYFGAAGARVALAAGRLAADSDVTFLLRGAFGMSRRVLEAVGFDQSLIMS
jgi:anti-anti-sigma regulatory factor